MTTTHELPASHIADATQGRAAGGIKPTEGHARIEAQHAHALGSNLPAAITESQAHVMDAAGPNFPSANHAAKTQSLGADGTKLAESQETTDAQAQSALSNQLPGSQTLADNHPTRATGNQATASHASVDTHTPSARGPILADPLLGMAADVVDDLEAVRCANENRLRSLTDTTPAPEDGSWCGGHGLTLDHPDVKRLASLVDSLAAAEHQAILNLQRVMRQHPLGAFVKAHKGVGEKQAARLLATIGDPYWNDLHDRPRSVSELWAYCGFHVIIPRGHMSGVTQASIASGDSTCHPTGQPHADAHAGSAGGVAPKRQRGQKSNWSEDARKRAWLIATKCVMTQGSPYRIVYDETRVKYANAVHQVECVRCGPSGKPALPGSPLSAGHQHARALRAISKALLKDLWIESRRLHELAASHISGDTQ